jgi:phenylalanyl-tRNA synthetase beta chain
VSGLTTLDGLARELSPGMVVIADGSGPVALGGVMAARATEIQPETKDVLIEAAWFSPAAVRRTARALGSSTTRARGSSVGAIRRRRPPPRTSPAAGLRSWPEGGWLRGRSTVVLARRRRPI